MSIAKNFINLFCIKDELMSSNKSSEIMQILGGQDKGMSTLV